MKYLELIGFIVGCVLEHPLISVAYLLLILAAWGPFLNGLGISDLFWHRVRRTQFMTGLFTGLLVGVLVWVRWLVPGSSGPTWLLEWQSKQFSLFFFFDSPDRSSLYELGKYLTVSYLPAVFLLSLPFLRYPKRRVLMALGLWSSVLVFLLTAWLMVRVGALDTMMNSTFLSRELPDSMVLRSLPSSEIETVRNNFVAGAEKIVELFISQLAENQRQTYYLFSLMMVPFILAIVVLIAMAMLRKWPPPSLLSMTCVIAIVVAIYVHVALAAPQVQYALLLALLIWVWICNRVPFKVRVPTLEDFYAHSRRKSLQTTADLSPPLLSTETILAAAESNWQALPQHPSQAPEKPLLVVVATSGGGIRAAVWTCAILEELQLQSPLLSDQIRIVTGASGGMVGASWYAAWHALGNGELPWGCEADGKATRGMDRPLVPRSRLAWAMSRDSLSPAISTMLFNDLPGLFWPFSHTPGFPFRDRGRALEEAWVRNTAGQSGNSAFSACFSDLLSAESQARIPSLIFSPMLIEDARRLLISNLDLSQICTTAGPTGGVASVSACEFFHVFPEVRKNFPLVTAARMNASFPFVSPAVFLPTSPLRRVVDAGYYDNYGVDIASEWVYYHTEEIQKHCSGILILEVRAYPTQDERTKFMSSPDGGPFRWLTSPLSGLLAMRERSPWYRNDERLRGLGALFDLKHGLKNFVNVDSIEFDGTSPLSWIMTDEQRVEIILSAQKQVQELLGRVRKLHPWT